MEAASALEAFAAISVGVAGFSAIVVALSSNTVVYDVRRLNWALGIIFSWALGAMFFSVLPFIFHYFDMADVFVWRVGLVVMGGYVAIVGMVIMSGDRRFNRIGLSLSGRVHDTSIKRSREMTIAKYVYILTAAMLVAGAVWHPIPGYYLVGMTIMLMLSLWVLLVVFFNLGFTSKMTND
jgi:hypothetical protein